MSGLEFLAQGKDLDRFVISRIRKNAAADNVGFEPGDIVVSLNNIRSEKLDLTKIYTQLNDKEGKKINLTVYRDGQYISRSFLLRREI
jgi:C-terminal processing protease CtpA/Prc